jgi:hypothetical protein
MILAPFGRRFLESKISVFVWSSLRITRFGFFRYIFGTQDIFPWSDLCSIAEIVSTIVWRYGIMVSGKIQLINIYLIIAVIKDQDDAEILFICLQ